MHRFDHNYSDIAASCNIQSIRTLHHYHDRLLLYRIRNDFVNSDFIKPMFSERHIVYNLRDNRPLHENTCTSNFGFFSTINRLKRSWNTLPRRVTVVLRLSTLKINLKSFVTVF